MPKPNNYRYNKTLFVTPIDGQNPDYEKVIELIRHKLLPPGHSSKSRERKKGNDPPPPDETEPIMLYLPTDVTYARMMEKVQSTPSLFYLSP
jgi:hypothetical protein